MIIYKRILPYINQQTKTLYNHRQCRGASLTVEVGSTFLNANLFKNILALETIDILQNNSTISNAIHSIKQ